jgi:F1F0 ATPase subunit 2
MMSLKTVEITNLILVLSAGALLGGFYFVALWFTIQRLTQTRQPGLLILGSYVVRLGITLVGFYLVMDGHWERLIACLAGFILARQLLVHRWQPSPEISKPLVGE